MHIYLKHPVHGRKVAIDELEAQYDEKNGWVRYDVGAIMQRAPEPGKDDLETIRHQWAEKYGRPPHHKKSIATLRHDLGI